VLLLQDNTFIDLDTWRLLRPQWFSEMTPMDVMHSSTRGVVAEWVRQGDNCPPPESETIFSCPKILFQKCKIWVKTPIFGKIYLSVKLKFWAPISLFPPSESCNFLSALINARRRCRASNAPDWRMGKLCSCHAPKSSTTSGFPWNSWKLQVRKAFLVLLNVL